MGRWSAVRIYASVVVYVYDIARVLRYLLKRKIQEDSNFYTHLKNVPIVANAR